MFLKNLIFSILFLVVQNNILKAQSSDFYDAITAIMHDAPNQFRDIRGKTISDSHYAIVWESGIKVPGTVASRFVFSNGNFYEGALLQTDSISELKRVYIRYVTLLDSCLKPLGYSKSESDNFFPGMSNYKKVAFLPDIKPETQIGKGPPHLALEVTHTKGKDQYTVVLYIYEH